MSFDRPQYLSKVLESLVAQEGADLRARPVVLFQDGAVNPFSGRQNGSEAAIDECVAMFRKLVPSGVVMKSPANLGVALNFERAERHGYETLDAQAVIFLEDDLVLSPHYIATIDTLIANFSIDERVGYVAAYGDHTKTLADQRANAKRFISLSHNWGFALYKRQWLKMRPKVKQYLELVSNCDYKDRDGEKIRQLFESWGYGDPAISQDAAKTIACYADNAIKLNTYACNAVYIGERGLHMNDRMFAERGYSKTAIYPEKLNEFEQLTDALYGRLLNEQRDWAKSSRSPKKPVKVEVAQQRITQPEAESFVAAAYRSILQREPDANGLANYIRLFDSRSAANAVERTISGLLKSGEFNNKWKAEHSLRPTEALQLALQRALLSRIPAKLRAVACSCSTTDARIRFIFDGQITDQDRGDMELALSEISSMYKSLPPITRELIRSDVPIDIHQFGLQAWAYIRREHPD